MDDEQSAQSDLSKMVDGPFLATFTAHLPFPIGVPNTLGHTIWLEKRFEEASARSQFGDKPFVNIRVFDLTQSGLPLWQKGTHAAIEWLYGVRMEGDPNERYAEEEFLEHDQWVTLETPHAVAEGEDATTDPAFTFHRCLSVFNLFLRATLVITKDIRIRTISSHDLRPVVIIGALPVGEKWRKLSEMYMHPEAQHEGVLTDQHPFSEEQLNSGLSAIVTKRPYITTMIWRSRAQRALRQTGDAADAIISFQIAAESLLFDTFRMLLIDEGYSSIELAAELEKEIRFKSLVTKRLPIKLGGQWDVTLKGSAVGDYWRNLYLVRNSIIHTGFQPHGGHANAAQAAYWGLRDHLEERLWANYKTYRRTLLVRLGSDELEKRGWLTATMRSFIAQSESEPRPFYWPYDLAGRDRDVDPSQS